MLIFPHLPAGNSNSGLKLVTWADGTDEEIAAMVAAADTGELDYTSYWAVGDERTVHLSAMTFGSMYYSNQPKQDVVLVLMNEGYPGNNVHFVWGQKDCLLKGIMIHTSYTKISWKDCSMRDILNNKYYNALPNTFKNCLKQFNVITGSNNEPSQDYISLFAENEIFGACTYSSTIEAIALSQIEYYKTSSNRIKQVNGSDYAWWERSPYSSGTNHFCCVTSTGGTNFTSVNTNYGVAPFGCI